MVSYKSKIYILGIVKVKVWVYLSRWKYISGKWNVIKAKKYFCNHQGKYWSKHVRGKKTIMKEDLCKLSRDGLWKSRTARLPTFLSQLLPEIKNFLSCPPMDNLAIRQSDNCFPLSHLLPLHTWAPPIYHSLFSELLPPPSPTFLHFLAFKPIPPCFLPFLSWLQDFSAAIICQPFCQKSVANKLCPSRTFFMPWQIIGWQNIFLTNVGQTASNCRVASHEYKFYCHTQTW